MSHFERKYVLRNTEDKDRLVRLFDQTITDEQAVDLAGWLAQQCQVAEPDLRFTGRSEHGQYLGGTFQGGSIRLYPNPRILSVAHEFAHHLQHMDRKRLGDPGQFVAHGWDFTWRLDKVAALIEESKAV